jgi:hypothetical protein
VEIDTGATEGAVRIERRQPAGDRDAIPLQSQPSGPVVAVPDPPGVESGPAVPAQVQHHRAEEVRILLGSDPAGGDDPGRVSVLEHREGGDPGDARHMDDARGTARGEPR